MKNLLLFFSLVLLALGCSKSGARTEEGAKAEVNALLDGWYRDAATTNSDGYFKAMESKIT